MSHDVLFAARDANDVVTLTLDDAAGLVVGAERSIKNIEPDSPAAAAGLMLGRVNLPDFF